MPQTITYQRGITTVSNSTTNINPTTLVTAPSTGVSRVIIPQFTVRCLTTAFGTTPSNLIILLSLGTDATGYGYIGGADVGNTPCGFVGFSQVMGTSHAGSNTGNSGSCIFFSGEQCGADPNNTAFTSKTLSADKINVVAPNNTISATLSNQIWALPSDQIGIKIGGTNASANYEVVYSFIFITES
jgi:hypothetical protein